MTATTRRWSSLASYRLALAAAVIVFHRRVLFDRDFIFPWDFRAVHVPLATLIADSFRRGEFPLWDPYTYCGMPIFANIQAALFYPPVLAATAAAAHFGDAILPKLLAISVVIQIAFAGLCAFELMRRLDVRPAAAWIGASVYELGCFFAAQAEHMGAMQGAAWLPLIWLCLVELRDFKRRWFALLVLALAMTIFAGLPQVALAAFSSAICLAILLKLFRPPQTLFLNRDRKGAAVTPQASWRLTAVVLLASLWAILVAAVQFFPTAELTNNSVAKYRSEWLGTGGGIPPGALLSLIVPNYWNVFDVSKFHGPTDLTFLYLYSSLLGLALALGAIFWKPARWVAVFATLLAIFTFGMLGDQTALGRAALAALPVQIRIGIHPEFLFCVFSLALAVLAGLGAERLLPSSRLQIAAGIVIVCDLILVSSGRPMNQDSTKLDPGITHDSVDGNPEVLARLREITRPSMPPYRYDTSPGVSFLWSNSAPVIGIPTANGCDPLAPERTIEARRAFAAGPRWGTCYQVENPRSPVLSLMNVRALLSLTDLDVPGLQLVSQSGGYKIYQNTGVMERFFFVKQVRPVDTLAQAAAIVQSPDFHPSEDAIVEAPGEKFETPPAESTVRVVAYSASSIRLRTAASAPAFLVATDSYYPGWEASIDGVSARLYPTDAAFRGVSVPAGTHTVEFRFVPRTLYRSAAVSVLALAALLAFVV